MTDPFDDTYDDLMAEDEVSAVINNMDPHMLCVHFDEDADFFDGYGWIVYSSYDSERFKDKDEAIAMCEEVEADYIVLPSEYE